jgi:rRNA maturation endonuclease Nob1
MAKYRCKNCNHIFETELNSKICPNCGDKNTIEEKSADDLIKDI